METSGTDGFLGDRWGPQGLTRTLLGVPGNSPVGPGQMGSQGCSSQHRGAGKQRGLTGTRGSRPQVLGWKGPGEQIPTAGADGGRATNRDLGGPRGKQTPNPWLRRTQRAGDNPRYRRVPGSRGQSPGSGRWGHQKALVAPGAAAGQGARGCPGPRSAAPSPGALGSRDPPGHITCRDERGPGFLTPPVPSGTWGHPGDSTRGVRRSQDTQETPAQGCGAPRTPQGP